MPVRPTLMVLFLSLFCLFGISTFAKPKPDKSDFQCTKTTVTGLPGTFSGFWHPNPTQEVKVSMEFDEGQNVFNCTGEPLEITVPNGQLVRLRQDNLPASCTATISVAKADQDNGLSDLITLVSKAAGGHFAALIAKEKYYDLPKLKNHVATVGVECKEGGFKQSQTIKVTYQNPPRLSISAGLIVASGVNSYGIKTASTGVSGSGVTTTQSTIAVTGSPTVQFVPFSFANIYLAGSRKMNLSSQIGVGVNPNLSSARLEFSVAPIAFMWKDIYFSPGIHIGQHEVLSGGFKVGDVVTGLSKVPTTWAYRPAFGFSISYNLKPLVKSSSGSSSK